MWPRISRRRSSGTTGRHRLRSTPTTRSTDGAGPEREPRVRTESRGDAARSPPVDQRSTLRLTTDWDSKRFPQSPDLVVFETITPVRPESWVKLVLDTALPSPAGRATPPEAQTYTIQAEPAFFIDDFFCTSQCDGDGSNPLRSPASLSAFRISRRRSVRLTSRPAIRSCPSRRDHVARPDWAPDESPALTLEDAGFTAQPPDRRYVVSVAASLKSADGQTLGYTWVGIVENWHSAAFTSFGDGHGVWEKDGGRCCRSTRATSATSRSGRRRSARPTLMPTLLALQPALQQAPGWSGVGPTPGPSRPTASSRTASTCRTRSAPGGTGLVWAAVREGRCRSAHAPRRRRAEPRRAPRSCRSRTSASRSRTARRTRSCSSRASTRARRSPARTSRSSRLRQQRLLARHDRRGRRRDRAARRRRCAIPTTGGSFAFIVTAEKDGDVAYVGQRLERGHRAVGLRHRRQPAAKRDPLLRGTVFTDRGVYRLGEEVHLKAILRHNTPTGIRLLPAGTPVLVTVRDSQNRLVDERTVTLTAWSSAEWTMTLPADGTLGQLLGARRSSRPTGRRPRRPSSATARRDAEPRRR